MPAPNPWKLSFACALVTVGLPLTLAVLTHADGARTAASPAPAEPAPVANSRARTPVDITLSDAIGRRWLQAQYRSNGHSEIKASLTNRYGASLRLSIGAGLLFETTVFRSQTVVTRGQTVYLGPGEKREVRLPAAAVRTSNKIKEQTYHLCLDNIPLLANLFKETERSPEIARGAIQAAVLMLTENAPLSTFAKFSILAANPSDKPVPATFHVNTVEILSAFDLLKAAGYPRGNLAATQDSQLRIEAMIDPLSHAAAMDYYRIAPEREWTYWRDELLNGDLSTRHYALYAIGRYYPEVGLQMLPQWARTRHLNNLYRTSAIQALAETRRFEAISVLQSLINEFGAASELSQSARKSIAYLENQRHAPTGPLIEFRLSQANVP
jgi:hypothetical protein